MKATELKIGDWVSYKGKPAKVQALDSPCIYVDVDNEIRGTLEDDGDISPIPLTDKILEENGWSRNKNENYVNKKYSFIEIYPCSRKATEFSINVGDRCMIIIDSVHELQHILWALGMDDDLKI